MRIRPLPAAEAPTERHRPRCVVAKTAPALHVIIDIPRSNAE